MSSILKALKKLEHDKASYRPDELKIDAEILRSDAPLRSSSLRIMVISALLLAGGSGATYLYMKQGTAPEFAGRNVSAILGRKNIPVSPSAEIKTEQVPPAIEIVPAQPEHKNVHIVPAKSAVQKAPVIPVKTLHNGVAAPQLPPKTGAKPAGHEPPAKVVVAPAPSVTPAKAPIPALKVSGIAYQGEGADSVAMVNGVPLSRGEVISGVKVEEIHQNTVRFSYNGEKFDIPLGKSNR